MIALAQLHRAEVARPARLGVGAAVVAAVLVGAWFAHRGLGPLLRTHLRWSLRRYGPFAPLPAAVVTVGGLALFATAVGPADGGLATFVKVQVFVVALIPYLLLFGEILGVVRRRHRRRVLRRAVGARTARAGPGGGGGPS